MKQKILFVLSIVFSVGIIVAAFSYNSGGSEAGVAGTDENGVQVIDIAARGGYNPRIVTAKAGMPTTLKIETKGTYDCSSALVIPGLKYQKQLPVSGLTEIEIPPQDPGTTIRGLCAMGMYYFDINFN